MGRASVTAVAAYFMAALCSAQPQREITQEQPDSRTVLGAGNEYLSAGAEMIRAGQYDDGIRLTTMGLERPASQHDRAAGLSNLCAAHAAKGEPDLAIDYCTQSIAISPYSWRAYSNRAYAHLLKGQLSEASADLATAAEHNPEARQIGQIRGMINERSFQPSVTVEDHQ
jgi:tetratricopeptide (TPR) repeat protein